MTRRIDAILFDADGVLQRAPPDLWMRLAAALGGSDADAEVCMAEIFAAEAPGLVGAADFADSVAPVLAKWGSPLDAPAFLGEWLRIDVDWSILTLVAELRAAGLACAVASNQEGNRARYMSRTLGYREVFDAEFYSCHLGSKKPTADYFVALMRDGRFDPARTLFIDDRADNVAAAREAGFFAEQFLLGAVGEGAGPMRALLAGYGP